jgi:hypothetical protein
MHMYTIYIIGKNHYVQMYTTLYPDLGVNMSSVVAAAAADSVREVTSYVHDNVVQSVSRPTNLCLVLIIRTHLGIIHQARVTIRNTSTM